MEKTEIEFYEYEALQTGAVPSGIVILSKDQARRRVNSIKPLIDCDGNEVTGIYEILKPVTFKAGEEFSLDQRMSKALASTFYSSDIERIRVEEKEAYRRQEREKERQLNKDADEDEKARKEKEDEEELDRLEQEEKDKQEKAEAEKADTDEKARKADAEKNGNNQRSAAKNREKQTKKGK